MRVDTYNDGKWVVMDLSLPDDAEPCRSAFVLIAGISRVVPTLMGFEEATVEYEADGRRGLIRVLPPTSKTIWARAKRVWSWLRNTTAAYEELEAQQLALRAAIREKEAALLDRQRALDERARALHVRDRFLQSMGHELRTPINGLLNGIDALRDPDDLDDLKAVLDATTASAARLVAAVDATLSYAKVTSETLVAKPVPARPSDVLRAVCTTASALARGACVDLRTHSEPSSQVWLSFDNIHVARAVGELIRNAIQVSEPGQIVDVHCRVAEERLTFEVIDRGPKRSTTIESIRRHAEIDDVDLSPANLNLGFEVALAKATAMNGHLELLSVEGVNVARMELPAVPVEDPSRRNGPATRRCSPSTTIGSTAWWPNESSAS